jgi:hypothetical protein
VKDTDVDAGLLEEESSVRGLLLALVGQIDIFPAGEEIFGVPLRLAVAEEDEFRHNPHATHPQDALQIGEMSHSHRAR